MIRSLIYFFPLASKSLLCSYESLLRYLGSLNKIQNDYPSGYMWVHRSCCSIFSFLCCVLKIVVCHSGQTKDHKTIRFVFTCRCLSYLRYLCLLTYSGVQHTLCCVFALFVFVLYTLCCQFLWIVHFWLPVRYSLTFMQ